MTFRSFYPFEFNAAILDKFPLSKSFADLKNIVYVLLRAALEQSKQHRKAATTIEILPRKSEKWMYSLRTVPVPYSEIPFTSGKSTNSSFIVLGSWFEFCPKIDISVK